MKNKSILLVIAILLIGLSLAGGTYAYLTMTASVTNGNYNTQTTCFNIDYNISNEGSGQDITGTLFPSSGPNSGLSGRVGLKVNSSCTTNGLGTLKLHINSTTSSSLMTSASSYCQDRKTLEPISGITTESACTAAGGRWQGYGEYFCENQDTLQRMTEYTTENACTTAGGTWKSGGSPLKYAVYNNSAGNGTPLSVDHIRNYNIGNDIIIYDNFLVNATQQYYYVFIWIDGYLVDNSINNLSFSGYIKAEAKQTSPKWVYTANTWDGNTTTLYNGTNLTAIYLNTAISNSITQYASPDAAMQAFKTENGFYPNVFLRHTMENNLVKEIYYGIVITDDFLAVMKESWISDNCDEEDPQEQYQQCINSYHGGTPGTYYINATSYEDDTDGPIFTANKDALFTAFGNDACDDYDTFAQCAAYTYDAEFGAETYYDAEGHAYYQIGDKYYGCNITWASPNSYAYCNDNSN